jgi:hypothetical protein
MLKLAVLLTGSPRFVHEGAEWWFNKSMPKDMEIDYYGHCWDEHDFIGSFRYYNPKNIDITEDYFKCWPFTDFSLTKHHLDFNIYDTIKTEDTHLKNFLLWDKRRDHILSASFASDLMFKSKKVYDAVLIMRFDTIIKPGSLDKAIPFVVDFQKKYSNKFHIGHDKSLFWNKTNPNIFTPWVQIRDGLPVMQDYMFLCTYNDWVSYTGGNLYERYYRLLNQDKNLLEVTNFVKSKYHPHIFWAFIGFYSNANFIANNNLKSVVLRSTKTNIKSINYNKLVKEHDDHFNNLCLEYEKLGEIQGDLQRSK